MNKKVKNATPITVGSITFRSKLEANCYKEFLTLGLEVEYETTRLVLLEGFRALDDTAVRAITYTPDFLIRVKGIDVIIECKGRPNDAWPNKLKLVKKYFKDRNMLTTRYYIVRNKSQASQLTNLLNEFLQGKIDTLPHHITFD